MTDKQIVLVITTETLLHSFIKDVITVSTIASGMVLNTLTLHIDWLNFWLGLVAIFFLINQALRKNNKRVIRGATSTEVIEKLRKRLGEGSYD